jgi:hypothetical protein
MLELFKRRYLLLGFSLFSLMLIIQCQKDAEVSSDNQIQKDSIKTIKEDSLRKDSIKKNAIIYRTFIFPKNKKDSAMAVFNEEFSTEQQNIILALNRLDIKNKWRSDTLSIPDQFDESLMIYSPFPPVLDHLKDVKKIAFFSYPIQAYALYNKGKLVKWGPTSLGKKSAQTKRGLLFTNWKKELAISTVDRDWKLPYNFNIHNTLGIGWHQYDLPGYPASHSCLRLLKEDAKYLYDWADQWILNKGGGTIKANGTAVIVFGDYNWGGKKPWKYLEFEAHSTDISVEEMNKIIEPHLKNILESQQNRAEVESAPAPTD